MGVAISVGGKTDVAGLIEQRLKQMVIGPIDQHDLDGGTFLMLGLH